jgi:GNAT superfamily N-acetyltransferase
MRWPGPDGYVVSDERALLDVARVHGWLSTQSYWAEGRSYEMVARSLEQSLTLGLYGPGKVQVGVCRWVTDHATFAWLCDVFVDLGSRGRGLGTFLVGTATAHPGVRDLRQVLGTRDAHDLYRQFGFTSLAAPERWMERGPSAAGGASALPPR